eukprot:3709191-Amphidinium_carterae.2
MKRTLSSFTRKSRGQVEVSLKRLCTRICADKCGLRVGPCFADSRVSPCVGQGSKQETDFVCVCAWGTGALSHTICVEVFNTYCTLVSAFYLLLVLHALKPLRYIVHPTGMPACKIDTNPPVIKSQHHRAEQRYEGLEFHVATSAHCKPLERGELGGMLLKGVSSNGDKSLLSMPSVFEGSSEHAHVLVNLAPLAARIVNS